MADLRPPARLAAAALGLALLAADGALAMEPFEDLAPVAPGALEGVRGGMRIGDFDIDLGITMSTAVDGAGFLESALTVGEDGVALTSTGLPAGGFDFVAANPTRGFEVTHTLTGVPSASLRNALNGLSVEQLVTVDITVRNFRDRIAAVRGQQIAGAAARRAMLER